MTNYNKLQQIITNYKVKSHLLLPKCSRVRMNDSTSSTVQVDPATYSVNPRDIANAIDVNTVCIVGSVPQYPHGIIDDLEALNEIATR